MKISIDASNFSFSFIGTWFMILSIVFFIFSWSFGLVTLVLSVLLISQKYTYLIPRDSTKVMQKIQKTLNSLKIQYQKTGNTVSTKRVLIKIADYHFFTILRFNFDKVYTIEGKYLAAVVSKYQRYN